MRGLPLSAGLLLAGVLVAGCVSPTEQFNSRAASLTLDRGTVPGAGFTHVVYRRPASGAPSRILHVYLDGDGRPWNGQRPAADPTPAEPLTLRLLALDPAPAVYLGRPCYHGQAATPPCAPALWTDARYSEVVVESVAAAARNLAAIGRYREIVWVGYSGGGTLAMLAAPRVPETVGVVTIAANLDVDGWTALHRQPRLAGSLSPARQPPLPAAIRQRHYAGGRDRVVPPAIVSGGGIPPGSLTVVGSHDHVCCWVDYWPRVLAEEARAAGAAEAR